MGGGLDLIIGGLWFQHGSPLYRLFTQDLMGLMGLMGFGWEFLYAYFLAWGAALAVSYGPVFRRGEPAAPRPRKETTT